MNLPHQNTSRESTAGSFRTMQAVQTKGRDAFNTLCNYLILFFVFLYQYVSKGYYSDSLADLVAAIAIVLALIQITAMLIGGTFYINNTYQKTSHYYLLLLILFIFSFFYFFCQRRFDLVVGLLICVALHNWNIDSFFKATGILSSIMYGSHLLLYRLGYIQEHARIMDRATDNGTIYRYAIGFDHPNFTAPFILLILASAIGCRRTSQRLIFGAIGFLYSIISYEYTNSRTALAATLFAIVILLFSFFIKSPHLYVLFPVTTIASVGLMLYLAFAYHDDPTVNFRWSQRPSIIYNLFQDYGLSLYGNEELNTINRETGGSIDNYWFNLLFSYGIIITIVVFVLLYILCKTSCRYNSPNMVWVVVMYMVYGMSEHHVFDYGFSILSILIFMPIVYPLFFAPTGDNRKIAKHMPQSRRQNRQRRQQSPSWR